MGGRDVGNSRTHWALEGHATRGRLGRRLPDVSVMSIYTCIHVHVDPLHVGVWDDDSHRRKSVSQSVSQ